MKKKSRKKKRKNEASRRAAEKSKRQHRQFMSTTTLIVVCTIIPLLLSGFLNHFAHKPWILYFPLTALALGVLYFGHLAIRQLEPDSSNNPTVITPDSKPRPKTSFNVPDDKFLLILGDFLAWKSDLPMIVLMQREEPLITLNKEPRGMSLSARFFNADGKIVAEIDRNEIHTNPANFWRLKKSAHRLTIFNDEAKVVADVEYLNPRTVKILGRFFARNGFPIALNEDGIDLGASHLSKSAAGEIGRAALAIP